MLNEIEHAPEANILFAGVQYLLGAEPQHPLTAFYPNFGGRSDPAAMVGPFREFVLERRRELTEIGRTRYTQTNECRRCVALLPAIWLCDVPRFHLMDIGTSAGLNLALDRFSYRWGDIRWGQDGNLELTAELRGSLPKTRRIDVLSRTGLDLHPVDVNDEDQRRWLEALIWPEHDERRARLNRAIDIVKSLDIEIHAGDALDHLEYALKRLPDGEPAVLVNSFALNQFTPDERTEFQALVDDARSARDIFRVSMESIGTEAGFARIEVDTGSGLEEVGRGQPHGEWVEFYARP